MIKEIPERRGLKVIKEILIHKVKVIPEHRSLRGIKVTLVSEF